MWHTATMVQPSFLGVSLQFLHFLFPWLKHSSKFIKQNSNFVGKSSEQLSVDLLICKMLNTFIFRSSLELWQTTCDHNMHQLQLNHYNSFKGRHWNFPGKGSFTNYVYKKRWVVQKCQLSLGRNCQQRGLLKVR